MFSYHYKVTAKLSVSYSGHKKCWEMFSTKNLALCWKLKKKIRILIKSERVFDGGAISYFATTHFLSFVPLQVVTHRNLEQRRTQPKVRFITFSAKLGTGPKKELLCGSVCKLLSAVYNLFNFGHRLARTLRLYGISRHQLFWHLIKYTTDHHLKTSSSTNGRCSWQGDHIKRSPANILTAPPFVTTSPTYNSHQRSIKKSMWKKE